MSKIIQITRPRRYTTPADFDNSKDEYSYEFFALTDDGSILRIDHHRNNYSSGPTTHVEKVDLNG